MYNILVRFIWDEEKNRRNVAKHRVSFETAALVFEDPNALSIQDRFADGEQRWQTAGSRRRHGRASRCSYGVGRQRRRIDQNHFGAKGHSARKEDV